MERHEIREAPSLFHKVGQVWVTEFDILFKSRLRRIVETEAPEMVAWLDANSDNWNLEWCEVIDDQAGFGLHCKYVAIYVAIYDEVEAVAFRLRFL